MRDVGRGIKESKESVEKLIGIPLLLKVNTGRGKSALYHGTVIDLFPAVFSVKLDTGEIKTFSYADVHTKGVLFLKK